MKKILSITVLTLLLAACSGENKTGNLDEVIQSKDLAKIKSSRESVHKEYEKLVADLAKLDKAIAELDPNKKNPLVQTITLKDTLFFFFFRTCTASFRAAASTGRADGKGKYEPINISSL